MQTIVDRIEMIIDAECGGKATVFAERLGINSANVSQWRSGSTKPRNQTIQQIADTFGYNRDWILTGEGEPRSLAEAEAQIVDALSHAIKYKSSAIDRLIRAVAAAAAAGDDAAIESTMRYLTTLADEYRKQSPPDKKEE